MWEAERTGLSIRHQVNGREKRIGKLQVDGWCSTSKTAYPFHGCFYHSHPCLALEMNAVNGNPMANCSPRPERTPSTYVILSRRRAVGMRVETRDEKRSDREKVSGCCISATTPRAVDDDVATDPERRACRNRVRTDRVQRLRTGNIALAHCRDAARVQEYPSDPRRSRPVHAPIRRRAQHHGDSAKHAHG